MFAVGWATRGTTGMSSRSAWVAGAQVDTNASSCGASSQPAELDTSGRGSTVLSGAVCACSMGAHRNTRGEKQKIARTNLRPIRLASERVCAREHAPWRRVRSENIARWMRHVYADVAVDISLVVAFGCAASSCNTKSNVSTNRSASASEKINGGRSLITL